MSNKLEVTGSLDIDYELLDNVLDDCGNKKWLACPSCIRHFEDELRIRSKEIEDKNKLIEELKQKIDSLESKNKSLDFKYRVNQAFGGYVGHIASLNEKIKVLEKENEDLKNMISRCKEEIDDKDKLIEELTQDKAEEVGKNIGKYVVECIREGSNKGIYKLNPDTRIDIHVEETNNVPMTFDRYAIPRIAIMFNNTQTEMERDTAQHECEELHEKIESLWRVIDELNIKIKALDKENKDLKTTLAMCERDSNMARNLCHNIAFNAERARTNTNEEEK